MRDAYESEPNMTGSHGRTNDVYFSSFFKNYFPISMICLAAVLSFMCIFCAFQYNFIFETFFNYNKNDRSITTLYIVFVIRINSHK